ncbi:MAG: ribosome-binding factor A [Puniceicoccales bacterium]|jgi:ribosome-binding factor A|nr:ribosome-binding factor A [Puniceicoccales bacterium]
MSQRTIRLNQLLLQEFSEQLHARWRTESTCITFTGVEISPDLHNAVVYFSVVGDADERRRAQIFLQRILKTLKAAVFNRVRIKYTPSVRFAYDSSPERGSRLINALDAVAREDAARAAAFES